MGDNAKFAAESIADSLESRSDSITSFVRGTDQEWPLVTLNDFEVMVAVMGLAHQDGVERNLRERGWRQVRPACRGIL